MADINRNNNYLVL